MTINNINLNPRLSYTHHGDDGRPIFTFWFITDSEKQTLNNLYDHYQRLNKESQILEVLNYKHTNSVEEFFNNPQVQLRGDRIDNYVSEMKVIYDQYIKLTETYTGASGQNCKMLSSGWLEDHKDFSFYNYFKALVDTENIFYCVHQR